MAVPARVAPLLLGLGLGCQGPTGPEPEAAPDAGPVAPELTQVNLNYLTVTHPFRWDQEFRGLATAALELGLSDIPGVVVSLPSPGPPPALLGRRIASARTVDARFTATPAAGDLVLELELCIAGGTCESYVATAPREQPWDAFGTLLEGAATTLGAEIDEATRAEWHAPGSKDPYAELLTGRACATYYGLLPPPEIPGDKRKDPVIRATFLDPAQPIAQWMRGRWELLASTDGGAALEAFNRAALARPHATLLTADLAASYGWIGRPDQAVLLWDEIGVAAPLDPRWFEPRVRALLAVDRPLEAQAILDQLPSTFTWDPTFAQLRVRAAEAAGVADLDPLLAHWQTAESRAVEPVRRRIDLRVGEARYAEALPLVAALRTRAPGPLTDALETALLVAVGNLSDAAAQAPPEVAVRLRARAIREANPGAAVSGLPADDVGVIEAESAAALWRNEPGTALRLADAALERAPVAAEARALRARSLEGLGQSAAASDAWRAAWEADPALEGGPVGPGRIASTFRVVTPEVAPALDPAAVPVAPGLTTGPEL